MGLLVHKQKGVPSLTGIARLSIIGFIIALALALSSTIWSVYLDSFVHSESIVGFISSFLTLISLFAYFFFIPLIEKSNKVKLFSYVLFLTFLTYIFLFLSPNLYWFLFFAVALTIFSCLRITCFGILIKEISKRKNLSRNEGLVYSFFNIAWVVGPLLAGFIAVKYGDKNIFLVSAFFIFLSFLMFNTLKIKDVEKRKKIDKQIIKNFIDFLKGKERVIGYILGGGNNLWWALIYIYLPLYIIRSGLNELWIGYFLFAVALPLILFEYAFSKIAGKYGFRKMFIFGYGITAIISLLSFFFASNIYILLFLLSLASVGMAMVEPTTEAYFLDILKEKEILRFYGPYNTATDVGQFVGNISAALLLIFLPFKYLFILFAVFMFLLTFLSMKTKKIIESRRE